MWGLILERGESRDLREQPCTVALLKRLYYGGEKKKPTKKPKPNKAAEVTKPSQGAAGRLGRAGGALFAHLSGAAPSRGAAAAS